MDTSAKASFLIFILIFFQRRGNISNEVFLKNHLLDIVCSNSYFSGVLINERTKLAKETEC